MSDAPEEFVALRKLLKLKRHEQPPPRFFNEFSRHVLDGREAEREKPRAGSLLAEAPWLVRLMRRLETNSLLAGGFATGVCALLLGGIVYSESADGVVDASTPMGDQASLKADTIGGVSVTPVVETSTNAVFGNPFNNLPNPSLTQISFSTSGQ